MNTKLHKQARCAALMAMALLAGSPTALWAATRYIAPAPIGSNANPGTEAAPFATILFATSTGADGDTLVLLDGTYTGYGNRDLELSGRTLTIRSKNGPSATIMNCEGASRAFAVSIAGGSLVIEGIGIQNALGKATAGDAGGGAISTVTNMTVRNCIFDSCAALGGTGSGSGRGGAVFVGGDATVTIEDCTFIHCTATGGAAQSGGISGGNGQGGAVYNGGANLTISGCLFDQNTAKGGGQPAGVSGMLAGTGRGGAVAGIGGQLSIGASEFQGNRAAGGNLATGPGIPGNGMGGAIWRSAGVDNFDIAESTFTGNAAASGDGGQPYLGGAAGGALAIGDGASTIRHCLFSANSATAPDTIPIISAAAMWFGRVTSATIQDSTLESNFIPSGGGSRPTGKLGVVVVEDYGGSSQIEFQRCTFSGNTNAGAALLSRGGANHLALNCTFSGNTDAYGPSVAYGKESATLSLLSCTVAFNTSGPDHGAVEQAGDAGTGIAIANVIGKGNTPQTFGGEITSYGANTMDDASLTSPTASDATLVDPMIDANLANNGGPTKTHALLAGSPCIDTGLDILAGTEDQRGAPRPYDGDLNGTAESDRGAFESADGLRAIGDYDNSGCTDIADFLTLIDLWQLPFNGGKIMDIADFLNLVDNWQVGPTCD